VSLVPGPGVSASGDLPVLLGSDDTSFGLDLSGLSNSEGSLDDFVVLLGFDQITPVPVPAPFLLLTTALLAGVLFRRSAAKT
jgi:hypothetical protein